MIEEAGDNLPFTCEQMFSLVADIERYPDFLRWWVAARILRRDANVLTVEQSVGLGPVRVLFASQAVLQPPRRIDVTSVDPQFRHYQLAWIIEPLTGMGCRLKVTADCELRSGLLQSLIRGLLPSTIADVVSAFDRRAHALYGRA